MPSPNTPPRRIQFEIRDAALTREPFYTRSPAEAKFWCTLGYRAVPVDKAR